MTKKTLTLISIILVAAICRLFPHAPNFTPLAAIALFSGAYISNRLLAVAMPIVAMLLSDALMGFNGWVFTEQVVTVYATYTLIALAAFALRNNKSAIRVGLGSLSASIFFFITTNFATWMGGYFHSPALYPMNGFGLTECFTAAIPFFQNTLAGDLFYSSVLFGAFYLAQINIPALSRD